MNDLDETNPRVESRSIATASGMDAGVNAGAGVRAEATAASAMDSNTRRAIVKIGIATLAIYLALLGVAYVLIRRRFIGEGASAAEDIEVATIGFAVAWGVFAFSAGATFIVRRVWRARERAAGETFGG